MILVIIALAQSPAPPSEAEAAKLALEALTLVGGILAGLGALVGFLLTRYWYSRDRKADKREREQAAIAAEQSRIRDILYASLRWFEGGTQNRSIGIAVVKTSWGSFKDLQPLWTEVLVNQAIYLIAASDQSTKAHEHENLRRIMDLIIREQKSLDEETRELLCSALRDKQTGGGKSGGLALTPKLKDRIDRWLPALGCKLPDTDAQPL